jgi:hypothetical protein
MTTRTERTILTIAIIMALCGFAGAFLTACQSYQPPGEGIWRAL